LIPSSRGRREDTNAEQKASGEYPGPSDRESPDLRRAERTTSRYNSFVKNGSDRKVNSVFSSPFVDPISCRLVSPNFEKRDEQKTDFQQKKIWRKEEPVMSPVTPDKPPEPVRSQTFLGNNF
jgi:hypothetical protein